MLKNENGWFSSSRCGPSISACVQVRPAADRVLLREGTDSSEKTVRIPRKSWDEFLKAVKDGEFDEV